MTFKRSCRFCGRERINEPLSVHYPKCSAYLDDRDREEYEYRRAEAALERELGEQFAVQQDRDSLEDAFERGRYS